jgi:ABC-2 type transport system ATP-binding protein
MNVTMTGGCVKGPGTTLWKTRGETGRASGKDTAPVLLWSDTDRAVGLTTAVSPATTVEV